MTGAALREAAFGGDRRALARLLTLVERGGIEGLAAVDAALARGGAHVVGVTGAPGVGKSTLVAALAAELRRRGRTVAIVAVDPSSPHSGGALLGDRVRMERLHDDPGVFVRSLASRGAAGGLSAGASGVAAVLAASTFDVVLVETVGAGQGELDVAGTAQTVLLVVAPGLGDAIQALKAGIVEVADVIVVNKADRDGADQLVADLTFARSPLDGGAALTPVVKTVATTGEGVPALADALDRHRATDGGGRPVSLRQAERRILRAAASRLVARLEHETRGSVLLAELAESVAEGRQTPEAAAQRLLSGDAGSIK